MPWTDPHWGFSFFLLMALQECQHRSNFILKEGHAAFDIHPQTMSNTMVVAITVSQTQEFTELPSSWPANHRRVQSLDLVWFPLPGRPGRILHYLLFTLYTGGQRKWWGLGRQMPQHSTGHARQPVFRLQSSCYCGCLTQEWYRGPQRKKPSTLLHRAISACRSELMKDHICKGERKPLWPLCAWRQPLYTVKHS